MATPLYWAFVQYADVELDMDESFEQRVSRLLDVHSVRYFGSAAVDIERKRQNCAVLFSLPPGEAREEWWRSLLQLGLPFLSVKLCFAPQSASPRDVADVFHAHEAAIASSGGALFGQPARHPAGPELTLSKVSNHVYAGPAVQCSFAC